MNTVNLVSSPKFYCVRTLKPFFREKVDGKKIATEGFEFQLDYNEHRTVDIQDFSSNEDGNALIYMETIGKNKLELSSAKLSSLS